MKERFSGAIEAFARKNPSATRHGEAPRHRTLEDVPLNRDVQLDLERGRAARNVSSTKRAAAISSSKQSSSVEATDGRSSRMVSSNGRLSISTHKLQPSFEGRPSSSSRGAVRGSREDLRSFDFLSPRK